MGGTTRPGQPKAPGGYPETRLPSQPAAGRPGAEGVTPWHRPRSALPRGPAPGPGSPQHHQHPWSPQLRAAYLDLGRRCFAAGGERGGWLGPAPSLHWGGVWGESTPKNSERSTAERRRRQALLRGARSRNCPSPGEWKGRAEPRRRALPR